MSTTFTSDFRKFFGRGLAILLPSILTLWILWQAFVFLFKNVAEPINVGIRQVMVWGIPKLYGDEHMPALFAVSEERLAQARVNRDDQVSSDAELIREIRILNTHEWWDEHWYMDLTGLGVAILLVYLAGVLVGNFFGKRIYAKVEQLISAIPGFKQVYPHVKQMVDLILGERKMAFNEVVLVEYPSKGIWTVGFLTGSSIRQIDESAGSRVVSVFIPTSPTPFTGYVINVPATSLKPLDVPLDQAIRFVISAGVLTPDKPPEPEQDALEGSSGDGNGGDNSPSGSVN